MSKIKINTGDKYFNWTIEKDLGVIQYRSNKERRVLARCKCGDIVNIRFSSISHNETKSCRKCQIKKATFFTKEEKPLLKIYDGMKRRCEDPTNHAYRRYGGRGIFICHEWQNRKNFLDWSLKNGYKPGYSIDRIDNNKEYSPDNCRYIPKEINSRWKSTTLLNWNKVYDIRNIKNLIPHITMREIGEAYGVSNYCIFNVLHNIAWHDPNYKYQNLGG